MRLKILAAVGLVLVGVVAFGVVVVGPTFGASSAVQYLTAMAAVTNVVRSAAATGSLAPSVSYGLAFGRDALTITSTSSASS